MQPTLFSALDRYTEPLSTDDQRRLFALWASVNREYVETMVGWAEEIAESGGSVSVQRLIERARWDPNMAMQPITYTDIDGNVHRYKINHNDRALFGRWLKATHPGMRVNLRKSKFDDVVGVQSHQQFIDNFADWLNSISIERQIFGGEK